MTISDRIRVKTKEKGLNIKQLEQLSGLANGQIGKWATQNASFDKLASVAKYLNTSTDWLITGKDTDNLTDEERNLIEMYRNCNAVGKKDIQDFAEMIQYKKPQNEGVSTSKIG